MRVGVGACMCVCVFQWDFQQTVADVDQTMYVCVFLFSSCLLQECIRALGRKGSHLPFRGSVLTQVCMYVHDIVEAHCYFVDIGRIDREQIRSRINNNDCRTFRPRRPLSTAYRTVQFCTQLTKAFVAETSCNHCY